MNKAGDRGSTIAPPPSGDGGVILEWLRDYPGGAALSERFKAAFKVALAMVIAYGISMGMDWDRAFWAALSVIFCSLATAGESVTACIDRVAGTVGACILALLLVALFPQQRWLFLLGMSAIIAFCSYHMTGSTPRKKVWFNIGFNLPIVALLGESGAVVAPASFDLAILRTQQTAMGALVYGLVAILVWPRRGDQDFIDTVRCLGKRQHEHFRCLVAQFRGTADGADVRALAAEVAGQLPTLGASLEGAAHDSPELAVTRGAWSSHLENIKALHSALESWRDGFKELDGLDAGRYIPELDAFIEDVALSLASVEPLLSGQEVTHAPRELVLTLDEAALADLPHLQRASLVYCRDQLLAIGGLAAALVESAACAGSGEPADTASEVPQPTRRPWVIDLDRASTTIRQTSTLWLAVLTIIYIESVPIPVATIALANAFAMALAWMPQAPAIILYRPVILGGLISGAFYMLLLPQLSQFWQFGLVLFAAIFAIAYIFHEPRAALTRGLFMTMIVLIMLADNRINYSFLQFANWMMVGVTFVTLMTIAWHFPMSFRAEDRLRAQLRRFWRSAAFLLRHPDPQVPRGFTQRWRHAFHTHQMVSLPPRLSGWAEALPPMALEDEDRRQLQTLLQQIRIFSQRMSDIVGSYSDRTALPSVGRRQDSNGVALRLRMAEMAERIALDPAAFSREYQPADIEQAAAGLQQYVEEQLTMSDIPKDTAQQVYSFLGAYRGLWVAYLRAIRAATRIDWQRLGEARF